MRIGELAAAVGVTTRAVRHYHPHGLLPEPERRANGYRDYTLRHAVVLARIRRLTELGLGSFVWIRPDQGAGSGAVHRKAEEGAMAEPWQPTTTRRGAVPDPASPA